MDRSVNQIWLGVLSFIIFDPRPTLALQTHGPPEGLYVHQLAHVLFAVALLFLIWQVKYEGLTGLPGFASSGGLAVYLFSGMWLPSWDTGPRNSSSLKIFKVSREIFPSA
jgi:hypothetical protein